MKPKYETVLTFEQLDAWVAKLSRQSPRVFAVDLETTGFNAFKDEIVGISLAGLDGESCYIPVAHNCDTPQLDVIEVLETLMPLLESPLHTKVFHNGPFDLGFLSNYGVNVVNVHDTQVMSFTLSGGVDRHNMDDCAWRHLDQHDTSKFDDVVISAAGHKNFADVRLDHATFYAAEDTAVTLQLWITLRSKLMDAGLWRVFENIDKPLPEVVAHMKHAGVCVDVPALDKLRDEFNAEVRKIESEIEALVGQVNLGSHNELRDLLFNRLALEPSRFTKGGEPSADAEALQALEGQHPVVDLILRWRTYKKLLSTYVDTLPSFVEPSTSRIHATTNLTFTRTGRLSMADPSLHQIPSRSEEGKQLRRAFVAGPGNLLICADYSQIEVRVLAHITNEPVMVDAIRGGHDFHAATAANLYGGTPDMYLDKKDTERQFLRTKCKTGTFLTIYGGTPKAMAAKLRIPYEDAQRFIREYFEAIPVASQWIKDQHELVHDNGYVETVFGRRLPVEFAGASNKWERFAAERKSVNYVIQGSAADLNRLAMQAVSSELDCIAMREGWAEPAQLLLSVHDELVVECAYEDAERLAPVIGSRMETAADHLIEWRVPIVAEPGIGASWYEAKE